MIRSLITEYESEMDRTVFQPMFNFLSQQYFDIKELKINNKNPANMQGRLWEKFISLSIDRFIKMNPKIMYQINPNFIVKEGYKIKKLNDNNWVIIDRVNHLKTELDGLYELYNNLLLIIECKSRETTSKAQSKLQIKRRLVEEYFGTKAIFLKIRPTNNETLGLSIKGEYQKKIVLRMPIELEKVRIENCKQQKEKNV